MSRGIVMLGMNNSQVDYVQLAIMCAAFIRKNMPGQNICLITDEGSVEYFESSGKKLIDIFDDVVVTSEQSQFLNSRRYKDTQYYGVDAQFKNEGRTSVYTLSPYDETLLIDSDLLICNDVLNNVWGSVEDIMINKKAINLHHEPLLGAEFRLNSFGIPMYWATIVYFKKGPKAKLLFDLVQHIKENWDFYKFTYDFPGNLYRNDYAFSIAIHILGGFSEDNDFVAPLPEQEILSALDTDQFYRISSPTTLHFFTPDKKETWRFVTCRTDKLNVHCMNKLSLSNNMSSIMEVLK